MDLEAPHDDVLTQRDQINTAFLLHGYGSGLKAGGHRPREDACRKLSDLAPDSPIVRIKYESDHVRT